MFVQTRDVRKMSIRTGVLVVLAASGTASAQVRAVFPLTPASSAFLTYVLAGRDVQTPVPATMSAELEVTPSGLVRVIALEVVGPANWTNQIDMPPGTSIPTSVQSIRLIRSGGPPAAVVQGVLSAGMVTFIAEAAASVQGVANHQASGLSCSVVESTGGVCNGPFDLSAPGAQLVRVSGSLPTSGSGPSTLMISVFAPLNSSPVPWGNVTFLASGSATVQGGSSCPADFNMSGQVSVQDLFDFLAAWFNQDVRADVNMQGGITVQDLFDFLTFWFAGCS